jgi:hypothetical protein
MFGLLTWGPLPPTDRSKFICRAYLQASGKGTKLSANQRNQDTRKAFRLSKSTRPDGPRSQPLWEAYDPIGRDTFSPPTPKPILFASHNQKGSSQRTHERGGRGFTDMETVWGFAARMRSTLDPRSKSDGPAHPSRQQIASSSGSSRFNPSIIDQLDVHVAWLSQKGRMNLCICSSSAVVVPGPSSDRSGSMYQKALKKTAAKCQSPTCGHSVRIVSTRYPPLIFLTPRR